MRAMWFAGATLAAAILFRTDAIDAQSPPPLQPPADVAIPAGFPGNPIDFFDAYSWQLFKSMVWPADVAHPGAPDANATIDGPGARVFETFKSNADLFQPGGADPGSFDTVAATNPCGAPAAKRDALVLASFSKFEELQQAGFGNLVGPIIGQNKGYVRYLTTYNKLAYDHIVTNKLYLRGKPFTPFPDGAIVTKSAWIEMKGVANPERFYRRKAWIIDPATGTCSEQNMGLIGLHLVQKTPSRPQWIWTTFEQIDNAPDAGASGGTFTFNDGSGTAMPRSNPYAAPTAIVPAPFNIQRITPINPATVATNAKMQGSFDANSPWRFYKLVMTQWPLQANAPSVDGRPGNTFPGTGATSAFANTTMETFDQARVSTGCMACHDLTGKDTDFVWSVSTHAFPRPNAALLNARIDKFNAPIGKARKPSNLDKLRALLSGATK